MSSSEDDEPKSRRRQTQIADDDGDDGDSSSDDEKKSSKTKPTVASLFDEDDDDDDDDDDVDKGDREEKGDKGDKGDADGSDVEQTRTKNKQKIFESSSESSEGEGEDGDDLGRGGRRSDDEDGGGGNRGGGNRDVRGDDDDDGRRSDDEDGGGGNRGGGNRDVRGDDDDDDEEEEMDDKDDEVARREAPAIVRMGLHRIPRPLISGGGPRTAHVARFPAILGVSTEAFRPETYDAAAESKTFKFPHNIIRWGHATDPTTGEVRRDGAGRPVRRSNARMVKWSDGSWTLVVGADGESFEMAEATAGHNYVYASQTPVAEGDGPDPGGTVLECVGPLASRMAPRPMSLKSEAHRVHTIEVRRRNMKTSKIVEYVTQVDPELEKTQRIRNNEDINRSTGRASTGGGGRRAPRRPPAGMNPRYLEDGGDYSDDNVRDIKHGRSNDRDRYDDDESEDDAKWSNQYSKAKKTKRSSKGGGNETFDSEGEQELVFGSDESDDDDQVGGVTKKQGQFIDDD
eukprot:CAMPEP_0194298318 /NCGR_PEP_ID=MMETSP0169-20130528/60098_1 /TAXON_ID=218684 /ORGANISM="Corethron pennatum, Strain L29A3" /LENGTH=513 /DNA_ID=CAMNT_0039048293 /DNA_START=101 /DNA_END=1642 /DNA_ORIENTATION=-